MDDGELVLYDPQLHTYVTTLINALELFLTFFRSSGTFTSGDDGNGAITGFLRHHKCNEYCERLKLNDPSEFPHSVAHLPIISKPISVPGPLSKPAAVSRSTTPPAAIHHPLRHGECI